MCIWIRGSILRIHPWPFSHHGKSRLHDLSGKRMKAFHECCHLKVELRSKCMVEWELLVGTKDQPLRDSVIIVSTEGH